MNHFSNKTNQNHIIFQSVFKIEKAEHSPLFIKLIFQLNNREKTNTGEIHLEFEINREMCCVLMVCNLLDQKTCTTPSTYFQFTLALNLLEQQNIFLLFMFRYLVNFIISVIWPASCILFLCFTLNQITLLLKWSHLLWI